MTLSTIGDITASATPRAAILLTGLLKLAGPPDYDETTRTATWRLEHGIVVTCRTPEDGGAHWHIDHDGLKREDAEDAEERTA